MDDTTNTTEGDHLKVSGQIGEVVDIAVAAAAPIEIGDHGLLVRDGHGSIERIKVTDFEDLPRFQTHIQQVIGLQSFINYFTIHQDTDLSSVYVADVYGKGKKLLTQPTSIATGIIDDFSTEALALDPAARRHQVKLVLSPTAAGLRWGEALNSVISQEQFLELVADGVGEIAQPDGAVLRDLVSDLNAIRTTEISSVIRTGGQGRIQLTENAELKAGTGNEVEFPEEMTLVLQPFAGIEATITLPVKITPTASDNKVVFRLRAPVLDDALTVVITGLAQEIEQATGQVPIWTP